MRSGVNSSEFGDPISVGGLAFDCVLQHRAGLRVDSDFVLRGALANNEGVTESAATRFLLEFLRDNFARIGFERLCARLSGLDAGVRKILFAIECEGGPSQ